MYNEVDLSKIDIDKNPPDTEPKKQYYYMALCRNWVETMEQQLGRKLTACIQTFGCQMNARDSEKLLGILKTIGFEQSEDPHSDFVMFNTCTVRENANLKVYGRLGYLHGLKRKKPHMFIALCGCMMQEEHVVEKIKQSYPFVDLVFGTHNIYKLAQLIYERLQGNKMLIDIWEDTTDIVEELPTQRKFSFKSGVNIMFGCNNFCSYCIVPYVRGRERSRQPEDILAEIQKLADDGVVEIMLLGQNVNSYGKTLDNPVSFAQLLREIEKIQGIQRIRFMTSHPKDLSDELIQVMQQSKKICRQLHLPLQSGSTRLLKEMNRRYTKESYLALVDKIKTAMPDIGLSTDIIVGFPGETEEDFLDTMDVVRKVGYDSAYTFIYSKRSGTPAAQIENTLDKDTVRIRFEILLKEIQQISNKKIAHKVGTVQTVLAEERNQQNSSLISGRLSNNIVVHFKGDESCIGKEIKVRLTEAKGFYYMGEIYTA